MKLLIQADDYGMTPGVASGIVHGIVHGIIRNTGMFTNMPWAEECVEWIRPYMDRIAFGIDLNLTTGPPLTSPKDIPTLVKGDGSFYSSGQSRTLDTAQNGFSHASDEEIRKEFEAQIQRFQELTGKKPDYIHGHAYTTEKIEAIQRELSCDYGIPFSSEVWKKIAGVDIAGYRIPWYIKPATLENQINSSLKTYILENSEALLVKEYVVLAGHMGYVDSELMKLSSYHLLRVKDLEAVTSPEVLDWVRENRVELVDYRDFI